MKCTLEHSIEYQCRLIAAVRLKSLVKYECDKLSNNDKENIKKNIVSAALKHSIANSNDSQMESTFYDIIDSLIKQDFPDKWDNLSNEIENIVASQDLNYVLCASNILLKLYEKYENYSRPYLDNEIQKMLMMTTFAVLVKIAKQLLAKYCQIPKNKNSKNNKNADKNEMLKIMMILKQIFRIFHISLKVSFVDPPLFFF